MNRKFCIALLTVVLTTSYAQAQISLGVRAGLNVTNIDNELVDNQSKLGFQAGVIAEKPLGEKFATQIGLLFATQGCKNDLSESTTNLNYLQLRLNPMFKPDIGRMKLILTVGPYLGYALSGKEADQKISFGSNEAQWKRLDFGGGLGAGLQFDNIQVGLAYNRGLINLSHADNVSMKNSGLALTVTYMFSK
jgi:hypothetical protein